MNNINITMDHNAINNVKIDQNEDGPINDYNKPYYNKFNV